MNLTTKDYKSFQDLMWHLFEENHLMLHEARMIIGMLIQQQSDLLERQALHKKHGWVT